MTKTAVTTKISKQGIYNLLFGVLKPLDRYMVQQYRETLVKCDSARINDQGYLIAEIRMARSGTQKYFDSNGQIVNELRTPEEVRASAASFENTVLTIDHPREMLNSENSKNYTVGWVQSGVRYEDGWLVGTIKVIDEDAIKKIQTRHRYFSCGYMAQVDRSESEEYWIDEENVMGGGKGKEYPYTSQQRSIVSNHLSAVVNPRAGKKATFVTDESDLDEYQVEVATFDSAGFTITQDNETNKVNSMPKQFVYQDSILNLDGDDADRAISIIKELQSKYDSEVAASAETLGNLETENEALKAEKSTLEGKVDSLEAQKTQDNARLDSDTIALEVKSRLDAWAIVEPHLKEVKRDNSLSAIEIQKLYLKQALPNLAEKIDTANENYISGLWDAQKPEPVKAKTHSDLTKEILKDSGETPQVSSIEAARQAYLDSRMNRG